MGNKRQLLPILMMMATAANASGGLIAPPAVAQAPAAMPGAAPSSGPIDIVANEQEFAGDHVIAKGNVRVIFKDSVIVAPLATLYRDPATGQPQRAIFTGHPRLTQGTNKIDADTLTFEMATSKIIADGHSHSEVVNEPAPPPEAAKDATKTGAPAKLAKANTDEETGEEGDEEKPAKVAAAPASGGAGLGGDTAPSKIITDADRQEYDRASGKFEAFGNVRVNAGDIKVTSDTLKMAYGVDTRPEAAIFTGHVSATQGQNNTQSDHMTYFLNTKRLQATGHVKSKVIQTGNKSAGGGAPQPRADEPAVEPIVNSKTNGGQMQPLVNDGGRGFGFSESMAGKGPIYITSDSQDYNQLTGRMDASGNVKIKYQDTTGSGPKVVMIRNADGQAEKVVFVGRSQITQAGKRWIADKIVMMVEDRKILAEGNTKAFILPKKQDDGTANGFQLAQREQAKRSAAAQASSPSSQISTTRIDNAQ